MKTRKTKKLSLKKETLRPLDNTQLENLDGVVGGTDPITIPLSYTYPLTIVTLPLAEEVE